MWKFDCRTGEAKRFAGTGGMGTPNAIAGGVEQGFDGPTNMAWGIGATELTMYLVNLSDVFDPEDRPGPALIAIDVDTPGMPLP